MTVSHVVSFIGQAAATESFWVGGISGLITAVCGAIGSFYMVRSKLKTDAKRAAVDLKITADRAAVETKALAERTAIQEWQKIADYHQKRVECLSIQNEGQQKQLDENRRAIAELADKHEECLENHRECELKHNEMRIRLAQLEDTVKAKG